MQKREPRALLEECMLMRPLATVGNLIKVLQNLKLGLSYHQRFHFWLYIQRKGYQFHSQTSASRAYCTIIHNSQWVRKHTHTHTHTHLKNKWKKLKCSLMDEPF